MRKFGSNVRGNANLFTIGIFLLFVGVITVGGVMYYLGSKNSVGNPSSSHQRIIETFELKDEDLNLQGTLEFMGADSARMASTFNKVPVDEFILGNSTYAHSEWKFTIVGDPIAYMNIWGAGEDDETFYVEIMSFSGNTLSVDTPTGDYLLTKDEPRVDFLITLSPKTS